MNIIQLYYQVSKFIFYSDFIENIEFYYKLEQIMEYSKKVRIQLLIKYKVR